MPLIEQHARALVATARRTKSPSPGRGDYCICALAVSVIRRQRLKDVAEGRLKLVIQMGPNGTDEFGNVPSVFVLERRRHSAECRMHLSANLKLLWDTRL